MSFSNWLVDENRGVWRFTSFTTGFYDDRWYLSAPGPSILTKRTLLVWVPYLSTFNAQHFKIFHGIHEPHSRQSQLDGWGLEASKSATAAAHEASMCADMVWMFDAIWFFDGTMIDIGIAIGILWCYEKNIPILQILWWYYEKNDGAIVDKIWSWWCYDWYWM